MALIHHREGVLLWVSLSTYSFTYDHSVFTFLKCILPFRFYLATKLSVVILKICHFSIIFGFTHQKHSYSINLAMYKISYHFTT